MSTASAACHADRVRDVADVVEDAEACAPLCRAVITNPIDSIKASLRRHAQPPSEPALPGRSGSSLPVRDAGDGRCATGIERPRTRPSRRWAIPTDVRRVPPRGCDHQRSCVSRHAVTAVGSTPATFQPSRERPAPPEARIEHDVFVAARHHGGVPAAPAPEHPELHRDAPSVHRSRCDSSSCRRMPSVSGICRRSIRAARSSRN